MADMMDPWRRQPALPQTLQRAVERLTEREDREGMAAGIRPESQAQQQQVVMAVPLSAGRVEASEQADRHPMQETCVGKTPVSINFYRFSRK
ncbi:hypothetical protein [Labrys miyagiensis]|uniref:hypothetical protein n=1 Tax=Labrys miyagiensis TaxID=346912 RepID=UPI0024E14F9F|nr:hypothetical protein [Labrys miyagiensis]